jgi:hypothetical protein
MRTVRRAASAALCAFMLLSLTAVTASANRLSSSSRPFGVIWTPIFDNGIAEVHCEAITLLGSFHSATITKVTNALIGFINSARLSPAERCSGGSVRLLAETLPWHFRYGGFTGTLPSITSIRFRIIGFSFNIIHELIECLYRSTEEHPAAIIANLESRGAVATVRADESLRIPTTSFGFCLESVATIGGTGGGTREAVVFRLI